MDIATHAFVTGQVDVFLENYTLSNCETLLEEESTSNTVIVYFENHNAEICSKISKAVERLKALGAVLNLSFQNIPFNFDESDFEERQVVELGLRTVENMMGLKAFPEETKKCEHCGQVIHQLSHLKKIDLILWDSITWSERFDSYEPLLLFSNTVKFFHKSLIDELQSLGFDIGLEIVPATIWVPDDNKKLESEYFWAYSREDIGYPAGDVIFGKLQFPCGHRPLIGNKNLLETYSKSNYDNQDFFTSSFSGSLYISNRVYQFLKAKIERDEIPNDMVLFIPVDLM